MMLSSGDKWQHINSLVRVFTTEVGSKGAVIAIGASRKNNVAGKSKTNSG